MDWAKFSEYGLLGLMIGSITILLFFIVKWVLEHVKELLAQQAKERESWCIIQAKQNEAFIKVVTSLDGVIETIKKHDEKSEERGKYVKEEHREFMKQVTEVTNSLGRINGYKD